VASSPAKLNTGRCHDHAILRVVALLLACWHPSNKLRRNFRQQAVCHADDIVRAQRSHRTWNGPQGPVGAGAPIPSDRPPLCKTAAFVEKFAHTGT
jgi:hypothetical protein